MLRKVMHNVRGLLLASCLLLTIDHSLADSTIDASRKYAYGANVGWIDLHGNDTDGVVVGEHFLSGKAYGANIGWINFGDGSPSNNSAYGNDHDTDYGVNQDGAGNLRGKAYGANVGWISFDWSSSDDDNRPRINLANGEFQGFAYGASIGWINLGAGTLATTTIEIVDADGDGIADAWESLHFENLTAANGTTDQDGDGVTDREEYLGSSDPTDPTSFLRILSQSIGEASPTSRKVTLEFTSDPSRRYQILISDDLVTFRESGLGEFAPEAGTSTTKLITGRQTAQYYRVVAVRPLQDKQ